MFCPPIPLAVISCTVPEQASNDCGTGCPAEVVGGAVLTYTVAVPEPVPPVGQDALPTDVIV